MNDPRRVIPRLIVSILLWASVSVAQSSPKLAQPARVPFTRTEAMITMRDGIRLHTVILTPQTQSEPLPIIIDRTPYGVNSWTSDLVNVAYKEFVADGYIFVFQGAMVCLLFKGQRKSEAGRSDSFSIRHEQVDEV